MKLINVKLELIEHHPNQPRTKLEGIKELADSIRARGIIVPPIAVADGNRYVLVDGHRRIAAAKLAKLSEIPVNVAEDWTEASMLQDAMAANMQRDDMSAGDTARGLQTLLDMGVDRVDVMKATGRSEAELAFASTIAQAPKKAAKAAEVQASLEEGAALVEFAGDEKVVAELTENIGTARFAHRLALARQAREVDAARTASFSQLKAAGVPLLKPEQTWNGSARRISHFITKVTPEEHASCAGHAATVENDGTISYWCTTPAKHNSTAPSHVKSEKELAEYRAMRASRAGFKAARDVRHDYARRLIAGVEATQTHKTAALIYVAWRAIQHGLQRRDFGSQTPSDAWMPVSATPVQTLLALAIAQQEKAIDDTVKSNAGFGMRANDEGRYYKLLKLVDYELADCEAAVLKEKPTKRIVPSSPTFQMSHLMSVPGEIMILHAFISGREMVTVANFDGAAAPDPSLVSTRWQIRFVEAGYPDQAAWDELCAANAWENDVVIVPDAVPGVPVITKTTYDPEIPVSVDDKGTVHVDLTSCDRDNMPPVADVLALIEAAKAAPADPQTEETGEVTA